MRSWRKITKVFCLTLDLSRNCQRVPNHRLTPESKQRAILFPPLNFEFEGLDSRNMLAAAGDDGNARPN